MIREGRVGYIDCSTGVSGDKFLGSLLDAGSADGAFTADHVREIADRLAPEAQVSISRVHSHGIGGLGVSVTTAHSSPRRGLQEIRALIVSAKLARPVAEMAIRTFEAIARAEARVHGVPPEEVHFHEVGAVDSIVDIVGVCAGVHALGIETLVASTVAVGAGTVEASHGTLPVPAPATALLLQGIPVCAGPSDSELTTPTGAALLATLAAGFGAIPPMTVERTGWGAGTRDIGSPNVCQLLVGASSVDSRSLAPARMPPVVLLETNIDHICAEELAFAAEELLSLGALDVWQTPIVMKKGRSAVLLSALATPQSAQTLAEEIVRLTGTLGVRHLPMQRWCAPREERAVATPWGTVHVKAGAGRLRPEHDDTARIAREHRLPYAHVAGEIVRRAREQLGEVASTAPDEGVDTAETYPVAES